MCYLCSHLCVYSQMNNLPDHQQQSYIIGKIWPKNKKSNKHRYHDDDDDDDDHPPKYIVGQMGVSAHRKPGPYHWSATASVYLSLSSSSFPLSWKSTASMSIFKKNHHGSLFASYHNKLFCKWLQIVFMQNVVADHFCYNSAMIFTNIILLAILTKQSEKRK